MLCFQLPSPKSEHGLMKNKAIKILSLNFILFFSNKTKKAIKGGAGIKVDDW